LVSNFLATRTVWCQFWTAREAWGLATMIGVAGKGETLDIVPRLLITGRRVTGSSFGGVKGRTQVPQLVERWLAGDIDVDALVTRRIALEQVNDAFEAMGRQEGIRTVVTF
jgi:S-(hydroxymethyl)glutathione dehydrogenase/alcohol dehydrogenase